MLSSWRELGRFVFGKQTGGRKNKDRRDKRREPIRAAASMVLEQMEGRTLLAVLPPAVVSDHVVINRPGDGQSHNSPSIAYDPTNPLKMVTVYSHENPGANGRQRVFIRGAYSVDGGASWSAFTVPGNVVNAAIAPPAQRTFQQATDPTVGFDRLGKFYVTYSQHDTDYSAGNVVMHKFDFTGQVPQIDPAIQNIFLYKWQGSDPVYHPTMVVNSNMALFTDPDTGQEQVDPTVDPLTGQGPIYVAWSTDTEPPPDPPGDFNRHSIQLVASHDGGAVFSSAVYVNDGAFGAGTRNIQPRLSISQGTATTPGDTPRVQGGQLSIVWDDFWTLRNANPPLDQIWFDRVLDSGGAYFFAGAVGGILDAIDANPADTPTENDFTTTVTIPPEVTVADLDVLVTLRHPDMQQLRLELVAPDGTIVPLFLNRQSGAGQTIGDPPQGLTGQDLGWSNGIDVGVQFDQESARSVTDAVAPYIGSFRPETGDLTQFYGSTTLDGDWILRVTDVLSGPSPLPQGTATELISWGLKFSFGRTDGADRPVATTLVRGNVGFMGGSPAPFPLAPAAAPDRGISASPVIASDNTYGSFSQFQGRLYVAYTARQNTNGNPADNTDIFLAFSDTGGVSWNVVTMPLPPGLPDPVNDDLSITDGFSEATTASGRPQFMPQVAVDQVTGTLVVSYFDARHDSSRARIANSISTSIDGGITFGPSTWANTTNTALDATNGNTVVMGPVPDNQSEGAGGRDTNFAFGLRQGLTVINGKIHAAWAGNRNLRGEASVLTSTATIASGPRIVSSTMGPVSRPGDIINPADPTGSPRVQAIEVVFDRIIDPSTFGPEDVFVVFRDPNTPGSAPGIPIPILSVDPVDLGFYGPAAAEGATRFIVLFDNSLDPTIGTATGTYSYVIFPDIADRVRFESVQLVPVQELHVDADPTQVNLPIPAGGTGGSGVPAQDNTISTIDITGVPPGEVITDINVNLDLLHENDTNLTITLIGPTGTRVTLVQQRGFGLPDFTATTFDDQAALSIINGFPPFTGSFRPEQPLAAFFAADPNGTWTLEIVDGTAFNVGELLSWSLDIETSTPQVAATAGNLMDQDADAIQNEAAISGNANDTLVLPRPLAGAPLLASGLGYSYYAGPFDNLTLPLIVPGPHVIWSGYGTEYPAPANQINLPIPAVGSGGSGDPLEDITRSTITINEPGARVTDLNVKVNLTHSFAGDLVLTLVAPGGFRIPLAVNVGGDGIGFIDTVFDDDAGSFIFDAVEPFTGTFRPDSSGFFSLDSLAGLSLSGDWTLEIEDQLDSETGTLVSWSLINSSSGDSLALNRTVSAIDVTFDRDMNPATFTPDKIKEIRGPLGSITGQRRYTTLDNPAATPASTTARLLSRIDIRDEYTLGDMDVRLFIDHGRTSDLRVTLIAPDGTRVPLVLNAPAGGPASIDFENTLLDDGAPTAINAGVAPYNGVFGYRPASPLSALIGKNIKGSWQLEVMDTASGISGTLQGWSLLATPQLSNFTVTAISPRTFRIGFPLQERSGTYTILLDSSIESMPVTTVFDAVDPQVNLPVPSAGEGGSGVPIEDITVSTIQINRPGMKISDLNVGLSLIHGLGSDLAITLITPGGQRILLSDGNGSGADFTDTIFDDDATTSILDGASPFTGSFRPEGIATLGLDSLVGQDLSGTWTLEIEDRQATNSGTLVGWSLIHSGGEQLDQNLNAGIDMLRGTSATSITTPVLASSLDVPKPVGNGVANRTTTSSIHVPNGFIIGDLNLQLNIIYGQDTDLSATLIGPDGTRAILFQGVGIRGTIEGFNNTVFDDEAATPIQNGSKPFFGRFNPQESLDLAFAGSNSTGTWTLEIVSAAAGGTHTGTLTSWSLEFQKPVPSNGLGEVNSDDVSTSFRIFVQDPANPQSHDQWTAVGPASISASGGTSGRFGGLSVDPSDPSGNTVYAAGSSGGIWKTTNFLTTELGGPKWIPLTDFGPTLSLNMGSLAVFGRNSDPSQSVVFGATGEANAGSTGVGFIRSMDGGLSWTLLDSTVNFDANGAPLAIDSPLRDHIFAGSAVHKVIVDPRPTPQGEVIVYAAVIGGANQGGIWRSLDSGRTWQRMLAGEATDVILDPSSGVFNAVSNPTGNLDTVYAGIRGVGVFVSSNRGGVWNQMNGGFNATPLIRDGNILSPQPAIPVVAPSDNPNGAKGRILLAKPYATGNVALDAQYQSWLYALVVTPTDALDGLYMTKDFGQNWTKIHIANRLGGTRGVPNPTNDPNGPDYTIFGSDPLRGQGNYDATIDLDINNPNIVYIGGKRDGVGAALIRIDTTTLSDAHSLVVSHQEPDGGQLTANVSGHAPIKNMGNPPPNNTGANSLLAYGLVAGSQLTAPTLNLNRRPGSPFLTNSTMYVFNVVQFSNTGSNASWTPFDIAAASLGGNDMQRMTVMRDPLTGLTRVLIAGDHSVMTAVDNDGVFLTNVGTAPITFGNRTGNLQISQFYYGASQPSYIGAQIAGSMFYGHAQDDGAPESAPNILETGQIDWPGGTGRGDSAGVATDQQGNGTVFQYHWPCCGGRLTDFFQVDGVGRTFGLLQQGDDPGNGVGQWPLLGTINFAVNPLNSNQIIISSSAGRIFGTSNQAVSWFEIGNPDALDNTQSLAMAFGAPNVGDPTGALNNFMYVGTNGGGVFVTFTGGGANGNQWINISNGLDGSAVQSIVTNPLRGSHEAYAVTRQGVYWMADSSAANPTWVNVTGNLFQLRHNPFGDPLFNETQLRYLRSMAADWRYFFPDNPADPNGGTHPILFVGGEGGVFRSLDKGVSWHRFPETTIDGGPTLGGYMPNAQVSDLDLALGNINPTTGQPDVSSGPDVLLVSTYGRGSFAIRMAPIILPGSVRIDPAFDSGISNSDLITNITEMRFSGISAPTAFGNTVRITLRDLTDPQNPVFIGGYDGTAATDIAANWTDHRGNFSLQINPGSFSTDGTKIIGVHASDESGTTSHDQILSFTIDLTDPVGTPAAITTAEGTNFTGIVATYENEPALGAVTINWGDGTAPSAGTVIPNPSGPGFAIRGSHVYQLPGNFNITVSAQDAAGNAGETISTATVSNPAVIAVGGFNFAAKQNTASAVQTVATFTDPGGPESPIVDHYTATIDWGDGTQSAGTITLNGTVFTVSGSHTYAMAGPFTITTTITHSSVGIAAPNAVVTSTTNVSLPDLVGTGGFSLSTAEGASTGTQVVATFTDPGPAQPLSAYLATIHWGDGNSSAGTIVETTPGNYSVSGDHIYSSPGSFVITTQIIRTNSSIEAQSSATVSNPAVVPTGGFTFSAAAGLMSATQTVATFTDPGGPEALTAYTATIDWGDGTAPTVGTITLNSGTGVFTVAGSHQYATTGTRTITVTISHTQNGVAATDAVVTSTANVLLPAVVMTGGFTFIAAEGSTSSTQVVARFTDPSGAGPTNSYTATINWGDGTSSVGTITFDAAQSRFTVSANHLYTGTGNFTITTTITRTGALDASTTSTAQVSDVKVVATGGFTVTAARGVLSTPQTVATFVDPGGPEVISHYTATINWGDGRTSTGTISFNSANNTFTVQGTHNYNVEGLFTISVTISHGTAQNTVVTSSAVVVHPPLTNVTGLTFNAIEGVSTNQPVATFTDPTEASESINTFSATINWGDGTSSVGVITVDTATRVFTVRGTHTYNTPGTATITVTIRHSTAPDAVATGTANIANAAVIASGAPAINGTEATAFTNRPVATFTDPGGAEAVANYSAMINWGDGSSSAGTITFNSANGVFTVAGGHTYVDGGTYTITTTISHSTNGIAAPDATATTTANIIDAAVVATGGFTFNAVEGTLSSSQIVATFTDVGTPKAVGAYNVEIEWGDSTSSPGVVTFDSGTGVFTVRGSHLYTSPGTRTIVITISHGTAQERTVQSTANVANAVVTVNAPATLPAVNEGVQFSGQVATFTDANPGATVGMFDATINWGDGSTSDGTIAVNPSGGFIVTGSHTYADSDGNGAVAGSQPFTVTVTVRDNPAGQNFADTATQVVNNVAPEVTVALSGTAFRGSPVNFSITTTDVAGDMAEGFTYSIAWGDGSATQNVGRTAGNGNHGVSHTFNATGTFNVVVTARDNDGGEDSFTLPVTVVVPPALVSRRINEGLKQRSKIMTVEFTFNADVDIQLADLRLMRSGVEVAFNNLVNVDWDAGSFTGVLDLSGKKLQNGHYTLRINTIAGPFDVAFHRLAGDTKGDRLVNKKDTRLVANAIRRREYRGNADLNADGRVNRKDLKIVKKNLKRRLPPP